MMARSCQWTSIKAWGVRIDQRSSLNKAKIAVAPRWPLSCIACGAMPHRSGGEPPFENSDAVIGMAPSNQTNQGTIWDGGEVEADQMPGADIAR